ncbi:hypothetical protein [Streptomyces sp. IBSBF 2435]|uniref:hypothetical protein n=1 Tax=Streptomyces sp. IBSBF 2435 TaxID=2903531 RepID=UPI002FDBA77E
MSWGEPSGPIDVTPADLDAAATTFAGGQSCLDGIADTLGSALRDASGMAGDDKYGKQFAKGYDPAAKALFRTISAAVRAIGQSAEGLVRTANNYSKADHHSNPRAGKGAPQLFGWPDVVDDVTYPDPPTAIGGGSNHWPPPIGKYWVNGHQDRLRNAAAAFRTAATDINGLGVSLHLQVQAITDVNTSGAISAMAAFWGQIWKDGDPGGSAPLSTAYLACTQLASVCEKFARAIDEAHSEFEHKMSEAGITMGITTALGVIGTVFTFGGSDAGAAALDAGEAAALFASVDTVMDATLADYAAEGLAELETVLASAAENVPEIEAVDAETVEVSQALDREMAQAEAKSGGSGGGGGGRGGGGTPPEEGPPAPDGPEPWGTSDSDVVADRIVNHAPGRDIPGVEEEDLPEYLENIMNKPGYRLRPTPNSSPRMAWWDEDTQTVVIREGNGGTFFQPSDGYPYFAKLLLE